MKPHRHGPGCVGSGCEIGWKKPLKLGSKQSECVHGLKIFLVDGSYVRNNLDSDFTQGNGYTFPFIPKGEIWIDKSMPRSEWPHFVLHECAHAELRKNGKKPGHSFDRAKALEDSQRRTTR